MHTTELLVKLMRSLPDKNTKGETMSYTIGYLMGIITRLADEDSRVRQHILAELNKKK